MDCMLGDFLKIKVNFIFLGMIVVLARMFLLLGHKTFVTYFQIVHFKRV